MSKWMVLGMSWVLASFLSLEPVFIPYVVVLSLFVLSYAQLPFSQLLYLLYSQLYYSHYFTFSHATVSYSYWSVLSRPQLL